MTVQQGSQLRTRITNLNKLFYLAHTNGTITGFGLVVIILLLGLSFLHCAGGNDPDNEALPKFGIYMPVDTTITYEKLQTMDLDTVRIKKWLTDDMIDYYDYSSHLIYLKVDKKSFFPEIKWLESIETKTNFYFWMKKRHPFIVIANGKRCYSGIFIEDSHFLKPVVKITSWEAAGFADDVIGLSLYDLWISNESYNLANDFRNNEEIKNALQDKGIFSGGLEYKIENIKIKNNDTLEVSGTIKNIDRNNLYIFNCWGIKQKPVFIFSRKDETTGYRFNFVTPTEWVYNNTDEYNRLDKNNIIGFKCLAVSEKAVENGDYIFYSNFYGERIKFNQDQRLKSDGRVWMGITRSNYMDINYNTSTGVTIKNKDYKF